MLRMGLTSIVDATLAQSQKPVADLRGPLGWLSTRVDHSLVTDAERPMRASGPRR